MDRGARIWVRAPRQYNSIGCRRRALRTSGSASDVPRNPPTCFTAQRHVTARRRWHERGLSLKLSGRAGRAYQWNTCTIAGDQIQRLCRVVRRGPRLTHVPSELWSRRRIERREPTGDERIVTCSVTRSKGGYSASRRGRNPGTLRNAKRCEPSHLLDWPRLTSTEVWTTNCWLAVSLLLCH
jgi:hypothetical protein